jgi:hypothetical protein
MKSNILKTALNSRYKYDVVNDKGTRLLVIRSHNNPGTIDQILESSLEDVRVNGRAIRLHEIFLFAPNGGFYRFSPFSFHNDLRLIQQFLNNRPDINRNLFGGSGTAEFWDDIGNSTDLDDYKFEYRFTSEVDPGALDHYIDKHDDEQMETTDELMGEGLQLDKGYKEIKDNENKLARKRRNLDNYFSAKNSSKKIKLSQRELRRNQWREQNALN